MNEELKDRGLKKAVREQTTFRLPSNFTYRTMQKVEEAIRLREKKSERRILLATIAAAIFLIGVSGTGLVLYFGDSIREAWLCKLNCVMLYSHSISSVGERPAPRGGTTRPDECKITTI